MRFTRVLVALRNPAGLATDHFPCCNVRSRPGASRRSSLTPSNPATPQPGDPKSGRDPSSQPVAHAPLGYSSSVLRRACLYRGGVGTPNMFGRNLRVPGLRTLVRLPNGTHPPRVMIVLRWQTRLLKIADNGKYAYPPTRLLPSPTMTTISLSPGTRSVRVLSETIGFEKNIL